MKARLTSRFLTRQLMPKPSTTHSERTSTVFRSPDLHQVKLTSINNINPAIRTFTLTSLRPISFLPGQWLDVHVPGLLKPGGYTITSAPSLAAVPDQTGRYCLHLAIQDAADNPVTEFFWKKASAILGTELDIRVGGQFTWPPPGPTPQKAVFVAGGVGINPLMSMVNHLYQLKEEERPMSVNILYGFKVPPAESSSSTLGERRRLDADKVLFLPRLLEMKKTWKSLELQTFLTGNTQYLDLQNEDFLASALQRRMTRADIKSVLEGDLNKTVGYVCGPPEMTDQMVGVMREAGLEVDKVLCEKWW